MKILTEYEAEQLLKEKKFPIVQGMLIKNKTELKKAATKLGFPLVLKNPFLLHKTEKKAVILNVHQGNLYSSYKKLKTKNVLVQKQLSGIEFLLGIKKDPTFGHIIAFGLGGILTQVLDDVSFRVCPVSDKDINSMISDLKSRELFTGIRNIKLNLPKLKQIIKKLCILTKNHPKIKELDINPLILNQKQALITDARIIFED